MSFVPVSTAVLNQWVRILGAIEKKVTRQGFDTWLKPTRFSHINGRVLHVRIPSSDFALVGERYGDLIHEAIDDLGLELDEVVFNAPQVDPAQQQQQREREGGGFGPQSSHAPGAPPRPRHGAGIGPEQSRFDWNTAAQLNPRYQFDGFVTGSGNPPYNTRSRVPHS